MNEVEMIREVCTFPTTKQMDKFVSWLKTNSGSEFAGVKFIDWVAVVEFRRITGYKVVFGVLPQNRQFALGVAAGIRQ